MGYVAEGATNNGVLYDEAIATVVKQLAPFRFIDVFVCTTHVSTYFSPHMYSHSGSTEADTSFSINSMRYHYN